MIRRLIILALLLALNAWGQTWVAPIGIPVPAFPSELNVARPSFPSPWTSDTAGFYYIAASGCSDSRTYGNPTASRCSLPASPAAGSVIALNGTISASTPNINYTGSSGSPIWIMGYNPESKPTLTSTWGATGSYLIFDSLNFSNALQDGNLDITGHHIMVRDCSFSDTYDTSNGSGIGVTGTNVVIYRNTIGPQGNWQYSGGNDIDRHGIKVSSGAADLWIVDNTFLHCHGDGVQVGDQNNTPGQINRVYLGRNEAYENYQTGFWVKNATDVIFSQNNAHDLMNVSDYGVGTGLGGQYDPAYVWFLANTITTCATGIHIAGSSNGGGGPWYVIGNVANDVAYPSPACNPYDEGAIGFRNEGTFGAFFNTIYNSTPMLTMVATVTFRNNILASKKASCNAVENPDEHTLTHDYNLFSSSSYDPGSEAHRVVGDPLFVSPGTNFALQAASPAIGAANPTEEAAFATFQTRYGIDIRKDILGTVRPQQTTWDIGAYEYSPGGGGSTRSTVGKGVVVGRGTVIR